MSTYKFKINGKDYEVAVNGIEGKNADVTVNGVKYCVEMENAAPQRLPCRQLLQQPLPPRRQHPHLPPRPRPPAQERMWSPLFPEWSSAWT